MECQDTSVYTYYVQWKVFFYLNAMNKQSSYTWKRMYEHIIKFIYTFTFIKYVHLFKVYIRIYVLMKANTSLRIAKIGET